MRRRRIGGPSGPLASALCLGALPFGSSVDEKTSFAILDRFVEAGHHADGRHHRHPRAAERARQIRLPVARHDSRNMAMTRLLSPGVRRRNIVADARRRAEDMACGGSMTGP